MVLRSLEIQGFKSFPDKTVLHFEHGLTAVVGPNGSGKSNISDAIRWVLGEQSNKALRSGKSEDVIFNGTAQRKSLGFAEVSLMVDNTDRQLDFDADDVKVTRRYYRSGESEYLLNNVKVRLEDVRLLFMDTGLGRDGYSIIGQGRIGDLVSTRSEERREIFEEAAGIAKYRHRKKKAESQLEAAEENLVRLRDILQELESRVGPLEQQSKKAKKYLEYYGEKKGLEIGLWLHTIHTTQNTLRQLEGKLELIRNQYDDASAALEQADRDTEQIEQQSRLLAVQTEQAMQQASQLEEQALRSENSESLLRNDIAHDREEIERIAGQIEQARQGDLSLSGQMDLYDRQIEEKTQQIAGQVDQRLALEDQMSEMVRIRDAFSQQIEQLSAQTAELALRLSDLRVQSVTADNSLAEIALQLEQMQKEEAVRQAESEANQQELAACRQDLAQQEQRITELKNMVAGLQMRFDARQGKLEAARTEAEKLRIDGEEKKRRVFMLEEMQRNLEGFAQSVKAVVRQAERGALRGICGPVSSLMQAESKTALAVETALGAAAQHIVCEREEDARQGIRYLQQNNAGRATFLPLTSIRGNRLSETGPEQEEGFVGIAADLVRFDEKYRGIAENLLGRTVVTETLENAMAMARKYKYRFRIVSLDGQLINAGGSMTGGSSVKGAGLLSRRTEIERLRQQQEQLQQQAEQAAEHFKKCQQEVAAVQASLSGSRGELASAQEDKIRLEGEIRRLSGLQDGYDRAQAAAEAEKKALGARAQENRKLSAAAAGETADLQQKKQQLEQQAEALSGDRRQRREEQEALAARIGECKLQVLAVEKEKEALLAAKEQLRQRREDQAGFIGQMAERQQQLEEQITRLDEQAQQAVRTAQQLRQQAAACEKTAEEYRLQRAKGEGRMAELRQKTKEKTDERERAAGEIARLEEKCRTTRTGAEELAARLFEEYELTRSQAEEIAQPPEDPAAANRRLNELKNKIKALGSVNVDAIAEYEEVSTRYAQLKEQTEDVESSRRELLRLIGELTGQMKELFEEKFAEINRYFGQIFTEMFGGGTAHLALSDPSDVLETGIELHVQPPGKVILNLEALSGGEKAMTAIVLLFAILKVTHAPFCIFDEIEAALDDVNVDRYAAYLRRLSDRTQFIIITHRRGTMEEADLLYGVTMQERGVSKLLELRASEVEARLGISGRKMEM